MDNTVPVEHYAYKKLVVIGFLFLGVILLVNELAAQYHIYFTFKWFDSPMHFLGGFGVGIVAIGLLRSWYSKTKYDTTPQFLLTVLLVLAVGTVWEVVEYYYKVSVLFGGVFWVDTIKDLLIDTFGGILSYICFHQRIKG